MRDATALEALGIPSLLILPDGLVPTARDALATYQLCEHFFVLAAALYGKTHDQIAGLVAGQARTFRDACFR